MGGTEHEEPVGVPRDTNGFFLLAEMFTAILGAFAHRAYQSPVLCRAITPEIRCLPIRLSSVVKPGVTDTPPEFRTACSPPESPVLGVVDSSGYPLGEGV